MARTKFPEGVDWKEYQGLIEARARSYSRRTGKEIKDLIQDGYVAMLEAISDWDAANGCPFQAFFLDRLDISFKKSWPVLQRNRPTTVNLPMDEYLPSPTPNPERTTMFRCAFQKMSEPAQMSCLLALSPEGKNGKEVKRRIREQLREEGYSWPVIWDSIREVKQTLAHL